MNMSTHINELITALSKAQGKIQPAIKDKKNPHFKSSYADLSSVWDACRVALSENGLAVVQTVESRDKDAFLVTTLAHSSGQWMRSEMPIVTAKWDPQGIGSALTYYRRYSLASIVGVAPEDDDAEGAQKREAYRAPEVKPQTITRQQAIELHTDLKNCELSFQKSIEKFCATAKIPSTLEGLPIGHYERLKQAIAKNLAECKADLQDQEVTA